MCYPTRFDVAYRENEKKLNKKGNTGWGNRDRARLVQQKILERLLKDEIHHQGPFFDDIAGQYIATMLVHEAAIRVHSEKKGAKVAISVEKALEPWKEKPPQWLADSKAQDGLGELIKELGKCDQDSG